MKVKVNLSNQTLEYMDSQPYIQGTDSRNKLSVYIKHSSVPQTEGAFNIMIAYALQNGRTTIKMANTGATQETIDDVLYDIFYFTAPKVLTSISGNFVATLILKVESNTYKVNVLNTVLNAVDFEAFEDALDDTASEVLESLESMAEDITYLQSQVVGVLHNTDIVDNDDSNDPAKVLSARMGKVLAERIGATTSGLVSATYNESTGVLTLTYENDDTFEMKIGLSTTDKSNMADDVENVILADLFETFSTVKSYSIGDFVNYENNIYEFVSDKSSGAWDSTKVVVANLNDYMDEVNAKLEQQDTQINNLIGGEPRYVNTYDNIRTLTTNQGVAVGTDTGHWYYWDGTQYVDGGVYLSDVTNSIKPYNANDYNNCNSVPVNSIITITISQSYSNLPSNETEGTLLTFNQYSMNAGSSGSVQIFISKNNKIYYRIMWNSWKNWTVLNLEKNVMQIYNPSDYSNANLVPVNSIMTITGGYSNLPSNETEGTLLTFNQYQLSDGGIGSTQLFISKTNKFYTRLFWGGSWTSWGSFNLDENVMRTYNASNYNNANLVPVNSIITITGSYSNLPSDESEGTLLSFNQYQLSIGGLGTTQIFISKYNKTYTRLFWGSSWTDWISLNNNENKNHYEDYIYEKFDFNGKTSLWVGDSIIHGETSEAVVVDEPVVDLFSDYCNMSFTNVAVGGAKIVGDASSNSILKQLTDTTFKNPDYLFIGAGVNDFLTNTNLTDVKNALNTIMDYIVNNFSNNTKVIFITPINYVGTSLGNNVLNNYRDIINETIISYNNNRFNIVQGYKFNFPLYDNNSSYKSLMSNDGLHPTQLGYSTAYLRGLIKALL